MADQNVVVVESPAKAKTINKYLGPDYTVIASYGHIRDLPAKDGSVLPDQDFAMEWEIEGRASQRVSEIARAVKGARRLFLATDPDREGEAISWHVHQCLQDKKALKGVEVKRVVFHEVTKGAVLEAMANPRDIDAPLVEAYLARRALDYLVGFTLSPVLWRKLPGSRSAGRVQSVALRLICEREGEIEAFRSKEYWTVDAGFLTAGKQPFSARLTHLSGEKLDRLGLTSKQDADRAVAAIEAAAFTVAEIERKTVKRHPQPPFTTSTLQQEASRKLGFGASRTMQIAQKLYEGIELGGETVGLITYMRTDGVQLSGEAIAAARKLIGRDYGDNFLPNAPRIYKTKAKNAQEAHEAVRPTDLMRRPGDVARFLDPDQLRLYELIWKRTVACQMESAVLDQVAIDLASQDRQTILRANGSLLKFPGFLTLYREDRDDGGDDDKDRLLPPMNQGEAVTRTSVTPEQHFTQPPPRYSEASLVKKMEELGIGRPSTYASIIQVLQDRNYVRLEQKRFVPEDRGRLVTTFLAAFFRRYVEYGFTADLENQLDDVSGGRADWKAVLRDFWQPFIGAIGETKDLTITQVIDVLDTELGPHFFPEDGSGKDPRQCPSCNAGRLGLRLGRNGGFIGCSNYPECRYTRPLGIAGEGEEEAAADLNQPRLLGDDPVTGLPVSIRKGPYGTYAQLGEGDKTNKPKRASLPAGFAPATITLDQALGLLALPREIGPEPESGDVIMAGIGRFGPYLKLGTKYVSLGKDEDVLTIGLNRAIVLLAEAKAKQARNAAKAAPLRIVGPHPADGADIALFDGRYGPYVEWSKVRATLPKGADKDTLTVEQAAALLAPKAKAAEAKSPAKAKAPAKKTTTVKKTPKVPDQDDSTSAPWEEPGAPAAAPKKRVTKPKAEGDAKPKPRAKRAAS